MSATDRLVSDYLARLESELAAVPRAGRREVVDEIRAHIAAAAADLPPDDETCIRNVLERLGDPSEIAAEARERHGVRRVRTTWREVGAVILLPVGGIVLPMVGWLAGVFLLWLSDAWTARDKLIGTLLLPGGLFGAWFFFFLGSQSLSDPLPAWPYILFALLVVVPLATDVYLIWRLRRGVGVATV